MHTKSIILVAAIAFTPAAAFAQGSAGSSAGQYPTDTSRSNSAANPSSTTNCAATGAMAGQDGAMASNGTATNKSANCAKRRSSSAMSNGSTTATPDAPSTPTDRPAQ